MKLAPGREDVALIDYRKLENAITMVADKTMRRADLEFGPLQVKVYTAGAVLRVDFDMKEY